MRQALPGRRSRVRAILTPIHRESQQYAELSAAHPSRRASLEPALRKTRPIAANTQPGPRGQRDRSISILLIEDNRLFRTVLSTMIRRQGGLRLLGSSSRPRYTEQHGHAPDVILLDASLGDRAHAQVVRDLRARYPEAKLIMMGLIPLEPEILSLVREGVSGFVLKDASFSDFITSIRAVVAGRRVFPPALTDSLLSQIVEDAASRGGVQRTDVRMTTREREIVELIADGLSNKEIGLKLSIATETVKSHVHNILEKLSLRSRVDVAVRARARAPRPF